jgi:hypothetical protein
MKETTSPALHIVREQVMTEMMLLELTIDVLDVLDESFRSNY